VSAVGTINFPLGMGFCKTFYIPEGRRDLITADTCSNAIIASTAYIGQQPGPCFKIYHNTSTGANHYKWLEFFKNGAEYLKYTPFANQIRDPNLTILDSQKKYERAVYLSDDLPAAITAKIAALPYVGNKQTLAQIQKF
jgi:hypothetical protein